MDFITIDGGEGGTGAGPLVFTDHVALPFKVGFSRVQKIFTAHGVHQQVAVHRLGQAGIPGGGGVRVRARLRRDQRRPRSDDGDRLHPGAALSHQPLPDRSRDASTRGSCAASIPTLKAGRLANYVITLRKDVLALSRACGVPHPALITADQLEMLDDRFGATTVAELFGYGRGFGIPSPADCDEVRS